MKSRAFGWPQKQAEWLLPTALAVLALTLPAYRYRLLWHTGPEDIYFELRDGFAYLSDFPALIAIFAWLLTPCPRRIGQLPRWLVAGVTGLALLATASVLWAPMPSLALYQAARLWLLLAVFLVVATTSESRGLLAWGLVISGAIQAGIGLAQFSLQRTLGLRKLGEIVMRPEWSGASVITVDGVPTLRAYGLTQHPNLLGGILMVATLIGAGLVMGMGSGVGARASLSDAVAVGKPRPSEARRRLTPIIAIFLTALCFIGLLLTFSRAAWLGTAAGGLAMLLLLLRRTASKRVAWPAAAALVAVLAVIGAAFLVTQWPLLRPRLGLSVEGVEIRSVDERAGLERSALTLIREHPLVGVGYGNFSIALWQRKSPALEAYPIYQPVHQVPLLAVAELGVPGGLFWLILALGPWIAIWRRRRTWPTAGMPAGMAASVAGALAALTVVSWFDFYPWFSQQGRLLLWICWGLWAQSVMSNGKGETSNR